MGVLTPSSVLSTSVSMFEETFLFARETFPPTNINHSTVMYFIFYFSFLVRGRERRRRRRRRDGEILIQKYWNSTVLLSAADLFTLPLCCGNPGTSKSVFTSSTLSSLDKFLTLVFTDIFSAEMEDACSSTAREFSPTNWRNF
jgi:hypothetical protein